MLHYPSLLLLLALLPLLTRFTRGPIGDVTAKRFRVLQRDVNDKRTTVLFDADSDPSQRRIVHAVTSGTYGYLVEVRNGTAKSVVGQAVTTHEFISGPRGCHDNIEVSNCVVNSVEAADNRLKVLALWPYSPRSDECVLGGGDDTTCFGPVHVQKDSTTKTKDFTGWDVLDAEHIYLKSNVGPGCGIPSIVEVNLVRPTLVVASNCSNYAGRYKNDNLDAYAGYLVNTTHAYRRSDGLNIFQRVLVRRDVTGGFRIHFASATGTGELDDFYVTYASTNVNVSDPALPDGVQQTLFVAGTGEPCYAIFTLDQTGVWPLQLVDPERLTDANFMLNRLNPRFYATRACGYTPGGYTEDLTLKSPGCRDGVECFGEPEFATGEFPAIPVLIPPNHAYDAYRDDCAWFYSVSASFNGFGLTGSDGALYYRTVSDQGRCYAPLYNVARVLSSDSLTERHRQCRMRHGELAGRTGDACWTSIAKAPCKGRRWYGFGERCYYKFDPVTERASFTVASEAASVCAKLDADLGDKVQPAPSADEDLRIWLKEEFMRQDRPEEAGWRYRVPVVTTTISRCDAYDYDPTDDSTSVRPFACGLESFPLCSYAMKEWEVEGTFISMSPRTVKVLRDGQMGSPWTGQEFKCRCFDGFALTNTGDCFARTCFLPTDEPSDSPLVLGHQKCQANDRGRCWNGDPDWCMCNANYAPPAYFGPGGSPFPEAEGTPCACAGVGEDPGSVDDDLFSLNGVIYPTRKIEQMTPPGEPVVVPCGGVTKGTCVVDDFTNLGECACATRTRISADALSGTREPARNGKGCECRISRVFSRPFIDSPVSEGFCNGRGTCCPFGETDRNPTGGFTNVCDDAEKPGCVCTSPGAAGISCDCDGPIDVAVAAVTVITSSRILMDLGSPRAIRDVVVKRKRTLFAASFTNSSVDCLPTSVSLARSYDDPAEIACVLTNRTDDGFLHHSWKCPDNSVLDSNRGFRQLIVIVVPDVTRSCKVEAYEDWFPPCGRHGNPHSARFSANVENRGYQHYDELQDMADATKGCTNG